MKLELKKKWELGGRIYIHYYEDGSCQKSWDITDGSIEKEAEARNYLEESYERLSNWLPKEEIILSKIIIR